VTKRASAQRWKGAGDAADGPPVLGASGVRRRLAQRRPGASGWALAAGSAKARRRSIAGRRRRSKIDGLGVERLAHMA